MLKKLFDQLPQSSNSLNVHVSSSQFGPSLLCTRTFYRDRHSLSLSPKGSGNKSLQAVCGEVELWYRDVDNSGLYSKSL